MKVKILSSKSPMWWYYKLIGSEIYVNYFIDDSIDRYHHPVDKLATINTNDAVITELPESFCVKRCDDGIKWGKYIDWLNKTYNTDLYGRLLNFDNPSDYPYYGIIDDEGLGIKIPFGTEIHIDDMIKHIDYMERHIKGGEQFHKESQLTVKMETQRLSRKGLKEIYSVACDEWQGKLKSFGYRNPLENYIDLTNEEVNEMFFASNDKQKSILSKYLKKEDDGSVDLSKIACEVYLDSQRAMIEIRNRYEYCDKAFWLNDVYFNWEIKKDSKGQLCLIPTKKK